MHELRNERQVLGRNGVDCFLRLIGLELWGNRSRELFVRMIVIRSSKV